jgi:hypothetical protein
VHVIAGSGGGEAVGAEMCGEREAARPGNGGVTGMVGNSIPTQGARERGGAGGLPGSHATTRDFHHSSASSTSHLFPTPSTPNPPPAAAPDPSPPTPPPPSATPPWGDGSGDRPGRAVSGPAELQAAGEDADPVPASSHAAAASSRGPALESAAAGNAGLDAAAPTEAPPPPLAVGDLAAVGATRGTGPAAAARVGWRMSALRWPLRKQ